MTPTLQPPVPAGTPPTVARFEYDVFISCHDADGFWVKQELEKPLQDAGMSVIGEWKFLGGEDVVVARQKAVEGSRHTLVVLTEDWCNSAAARDDALLARHIDPAAQARRLLPLMLKPCRRPGWLENLVPYDFTSPEACPASLAKMLEELGRSREAITKVLAQNARKGLAALGQLMRSDQVRGIVLLAHDSLSSARNDIAELSRWKQLHECLHHTAALVPTLAEKKNAVAAAAEVHEGEIDGDDLLDDAWMNFEFFLRTDFTPAIERLIAFARPPAFQPAQVSWISLFKKAREGLQDGVNERALAPIKAGIDLLMQHVSPKMTQVNQKLFATAERLPLRALVGHLSGLAEKIAEQLERTGLDDQASARVQSFRQGVRAIQELAETLEVSVTNHNCLQTIEDTVGHLFPPRVTPADVELHDPLLAEPLGVLRGERGNDWVQTLRLRRSQLGEALAACRAAGPEDRAALRKLRSVFIALRGEVSFGFTRVDGELLKFCEEVQKVGDSLAAALKGMHQ